MRLHRRGNRPERVQEKEALYGETDLGVTGALVTALAMVVTTSSKAGAAAPTHSALSTVVLDITAQSGPGNLLGNLLCGIANLLNRSAPAGAVATILNRLLAVL